MGAKKLIKIYCLRGVGLSDALIDSDDRWIRQWEKKIKRKVLSDGHPVELITVAGQYEDLFDDVRARPSDDIAFSEGIVRMGWQHLEEAGGSLFRKEMGLDAGIEALYWHAGMVVHWASNDGLRQELRQRIRSEIENVKPDIVLAHSLGSLVAYDTFVHGGMDLIRDRFFVSFGSQIGNPYIRRVFGGRLIGLKGARKWFHLYNPRDAVFTYPIRMPSQEEEQTSSFAQVNTPFDNPDPLDHTAVSTGAGTIGYLDHFAARQLVWPELLGSRPTDRAARSLKRIRHRISESHDHRALLIGIDRYHHQAIPQLSGCVNDTFLFSEILQSNGFPHDQIRLLHNERATTTAIRDRLEWLLDDVDTHGGDHGECRILFFSGHGAQLESYGVQETADRRDECLCPTDFDWSMERAIIDDQIFDLYSQIPYEANLIMIFDCCHAGGIARSGANVRGLSNPLDVAHRGLRYHEKEGLWMARSKEKGNFARKGHSVARRRPFEVGFQLGEDNQDSAALWFGSDRTVRKLGRAPSLRELENDDYDRVRKEIGHKGPYLPVIFEACGENEPAQEHTEGAVTYGAFTFCFLQALKQSGGAKAGLSYHDLLTKTKAKLDRLGYSQTPKLLCPPGKITLPDFRPNTSRREKG